ncbi:methyltransferase [Seohaeicola zhoushanensis]|uniref:Methyltransferase n=1 Tax=Seohaeicola zhoushanensis TaxID=1569283 RepID=A0A8J3GV68_9RHOB|nr:methyltransferase [Seohaeicola zhoushanensis]
MSFAPEDLSRDAFLRGRMWLYQPKSGYRSGLDPVLLAAAAPVLPGQSVLDLGCGVGAAALCLLARVPGARAVGLEIQPAYHELALRNAAENGVDFRPVLGDVADGARALQGENFDHVIANPPYYRAGAHTRASDAGRQTALGEALPLAEWIATAARRLKPRGFFHMIQRADRLPDMLAGCAGRLGALELLPLAARPGRAPELVILRARKDGRAPFRLHAPLVLHSDDRSLGNGKNYSPAIAAVQADAAPLPWPEA